MHTESGFLRTMCFDIVKKSKQSILGRGRGEETELKALKHLASLYWRWMIRISKDAKTLDRTVDYHYVDLRNTTETFIAELKVSQTSEFAWVDELFAEAWSGISERP